MLLRPRSLLLCVLLLTACARDAARLDDVQKMAYGVRPAVVRISAFATADFRYPIETVKAFEKTLRVKARAAESVVETGAGGSGSGFIINPDGMILTSGHVVAPTRDAAALERELRRNGAISALVRHFPVDTLRRMHRDEELDRYVAPLAAAGRLENRKVVNQVELSNGEALSFAILRYSPALHEGGTDLAVLSVQRKQLPSLPLGDSDSVHVGESIWSVGYPAVASSTDEVIGGWLSRESDLESTFNPGTITAIKRNVENTPVFQSNVAIYRGNSGGPAVNRRGEVIGISTWGHSQAEQIKFLVPVNVSKKLLAEAKIAPSAGGAFNVHYRSALDAAGEGRWLDAQKELKRASALFPNSPDLMRFDNDVTRAIGTLPPWRLHPVATAAGALLILVTIGVAAFLLLRRNPGRFPADVLKAPTVQTVVAPTGAPPVASSVIGRFTILNGNRAGEKLGLGGSGIRIGRESTICEIVLENPKVSRLHAEVVSIDGKVMLIDRNSSNGTYVNDQKIDKRFLQDGDIIYFGGRNAVAVAFHA
jgi:serine protease Do